jgi:uncharacterized protein (DUF697 family)
MSERDADAIATIALIAALADGRRQPEEQAQLARVADQMGGGDFGRMTGLVLSGQLRLADVVVRLTDEAARLEAFETAMTMCYADDVATESEKTFLAELRVSLQIDPEVADRLQRDIEALAAARLLRPDAHAEPAAPRPSQAALPAMTEDAATEDMIMSTAVLAAALELLPQRLAGLAIVPLQGRMVYRIGADFGQQLDAAQVADLAGAMGIGAAAQLLEGTARRLLGGAARSVGGGLAGRVGEAATGAALTFATTYALGHAARQYYGQGRRLSREDLRGLFSRLREEAAANFPKVEQSIRAKASGLDLGSVMRTLRG